jgi:K+-transporting ATPase ATPase C chain
VDLVTTSGSGLDPDITIAGALYQVPRIAAARGLSQDAVTNLVTEHETGRFLDIFGEPYVNVLDLNLALDALK